jgi:hypothetical protein
MDDGAFDERVWSSVYAAGSTTQAAAQANTPGSLKAATDAHATKLGL